MNDTWPATYDGIFRWIQSIARLEIQRDRDRRLSELTRLVMPFSPSGAPPLYHLSDDDIAWMLEQVASRQG